MGHKSLAAFDINYLFPLFIFPLGNPKISHNNQKSFRSLYEPEAIYGREVNLSATFLSQLEGRLGLTYIPDDHGDLETTFGSEDVFSYAYAVFHSPAYRQRYAEFLKGDFPRLPLTGNKALFAALVCLGAALISLHLLDSPRLENLLTRFPVPGSQAVTGVRYDDNSRRVYLNAEQYFEGVPPEVWTFTVGGYQVCHKWLKDRKGRTLTFTDLRHYQKIVVALAETIRLMAEIDAAIDAHGGWPIAGSA
jgi:predicted helicase